MKFDHNEFFEAYYRQWGPLARPQQEGLEFLLTCFGNDPNMQDLRWIAYALATTKHECADQWEPIEEYGKGKGRPYGKPVPVTDQCGTTIQQVFYGRGYVQLTWKTNYEKMDKALGLGGFLVTNPDLALDADVAYKIMSYGMRKGAFTGVGLSRYIDGTRCDYRNARKIINGTDKCDLIAGYAERFTAILCECKED